MMLRPLCIISVATIISISAQFTIHLEIGHDIVPITLQSLAVLCSAYYLKPVESFLAVGTYLIAGAIGLPIFADGSSGCSKITGPTGGYLMGFLFAAVTVSWMKNYLPILVLMLCGTIIILFLGVLYLSYLKGTQVALDYGLYPLMRGAVIKIIAGAVICHVGNICFEKFKVVRTSI